MKATTAAPAIGERIGRAVGKAIQGKVKGAAKAAGTKLVNAVAAKVFPALRLKGKAAKPGKEAKPNRMDVRTAAAFLGHLGKGTRHRITPADAKARSRRLAFARKIWVSMTPTQRYRRKITKAKS